MFPKRAMILSTCILTLLLQNAGIASAPLGGGLNDVFEAIGSSGKVDWTTSVITAVGIGAPPTQTDNASQARVVAERAALDSAYRNLLESVKGVRVDSTTTVGNIMAASDEIKSEVNGIIQGATVMDRKYVSDGSVETTVSMRLAGALADTLLPTGSAAAAASQSSAATPASPANASQLYTGLIVDARGLGARPAMEPKIMNEDGKEVYGLASISRDYAVREGMVAYLKDTTVAKADPRVADKPLLVKAVKVLGDAHVDLTISNADAAAIQSAFKNSSMLEKCRVIILVD